MKQKQSKAQENLAGLWEHDMYNESWLEKIQAEVEEERRNYKGPWCCLTMEAELTKKGAMLCYSKKFREYGIKIPKSTGCMIMNYCVACGKKLPSSLRKEWHDILEKEYGLDDPGWHTQEKKIPAEFLTDEWWKKRNL